MSEQTEDILQDERSQEDVTSLLIVAAGKKRHVPFKSDKINIEIIFQEDYDKISICDFYNNAMLNNFDLYLFLGNNHNIADEKCIDTMSSALLSPQNRIFACAYADFEVVEESKVITYQYNPAYSGEFLKTGIILNFPFMLPSYHLIPKFNPGMEMLTLYDGLIQILKVAPMLHIAEPLFTIDNALTTVQLNRDIEKINELHFNT